MNQNNMQKVRQISPEEVERARQMTPEELQKTQVLNLQELEETARFERRTSKKPAIILAIIGAIFFLTGTTIQIASALKTTPEENTIKNREIEEPIVKEVHSTLNCTKTSINNPDGTDTIFNIIYNFTDHQLTGFTKDFTMSENPTAPQGHETIGAYIAGYQNFLELLDGYNITVTPNETQTQIKVLVEVDLTRLNLLTVPPIKQTHFSTSIDYELNAKEELIKQDMLNNNYICN